MNTQKTPSEPLLSGGLFGEWYPIGTAPTAPRGILDPTPRFLLLCKSRRIEIGWYDHDSYARKPRPFWHLDGRWGRVLDMRGDQPTHWMPLPPNAGDEQRRTRDDANRTD